MHAGQPDILASQLVHCCAYGKHRAVSLLHLDVLPGILPPCPVDEQDVHGSVVTLTVSALLAAASSIIKAIQPDVCLLVGDESVKFVNELHVIR